MDCVKGLICSILGSRQQLAASSIPAPASVLVNTVVAALAAVTAPAVACIGLGLNGLTNQSSLDISSTTSINLGLSSRPMTPYGLISHI